ncbi:TadA family conjugal transfer-associated ATPase [Knoellia locipacati]|uniref:TadA family conjugal transfer-associated ATPase n=1 Tax=Knoellia locipacati TaxID=882824 RepID=UPI00384B80C4
MDRWPGVAEAIRGGLAPDADVIAELTGGVVELGADGAAVEGQRLRERVLGFGPLERWVNAAEVTDVLVNGDGSVWVDRGDGVRATGQVLEAADARALATRLAGLARRRLDEAQPWVDGVLPGGVRLHAILSPLAEAGTHLSLRVPRRQPVGVEGLQQLGSVGSTMASLLRRIVAARLSFLVVGGTGAGKTTVLGALLAECPTDQRIVVVEDVRELAPSHPHVVRLQGRTPNVEGVGAVTLVDLVRQGLRMRPDRLVVGEVRGAEVRELLSALNTGHDGGAGTLHANGLAETPARIEALGALAGLGRDAVHAQLRGAVQVVVDVARAGPVRFVRAVGVTRWTGTEVVVDEALVALPGGGLAGTGGTSGTGGTGGTGGADPERDAVEWGPGAARLAELLESRLGTTGGVESRVGTGGSATGVATRGGVA